MSFQVFKTNMSLWMQTPDKLATGNAESYQDFADKLTAEYDIAVKSGYQTINLVRVSKGNTELMKSLITIACLTALNKQEGKHNFIDEIGKAVLGYWTGCQLTSGIPPLLPAVLAVEGPIPPLPTNMYNVSGSKNAGIIPLTIPPEAPPPPPVAFAPVTEG